MFYFLYTYFGVNIFQYVTFRAGAAAVTAFLASVIFGGRIIGALKKWGMCEDAGKTDSDELNRLHSAKTGTPTMGGFILVGSILASCVLWGDLGNRLLQVGLLATAFLGLVGFIDDYIKLKVPNVKGLVPKTKLLFQLAIAVLVATVLYLRFRHMPNGLSLQVPFLKDEIIDSTFGENFNHLGWGYILLVVGVIVATSNAVNLTDGLDGLATGCVAMSGLAFGILAYVASHRIAARYLYVYFLPGSHEMVILSMALFGSALGFLWYNCNPAMVIMGDTGALPVGGLVGYVAVVIHQELLLFLVGGVFVAEALSVILQVVGFKLTGRRIFKIAPLHHHFQFSGWPENHVVVRFWVVAIVLAILGVVTLKIR